jgi:phosphomannomutase
MPEITIPEIIDSLSSITETSDVFIKDTLQVGGNQSGGGLFGDHITFPLAVVCCLTVCSMSCTIICIIHNNSMCR